MTDSDFVQGLSGQPAASVASWLDETLDSIGVETSLAADDKVRGARHFADYSAARAKALQAVFASVSAALERLRRPASTLSSDHRSRSLIIATPLVLA